MAQHKAKKIETYYDKHINTVVYEYRGSTYEVRYAKDWTISITPAWVQHKEAQAKIDELIDHPVKRNTETKPITLDDIFAFEE